MMEKVFVKKILLFSSSSIIIIHSRLNFLSENIPENNSKFIIDEERRGKQEREMPNIWINE